MIKSQKMLLCGSILLVAIFAATFFILPVYATADTFNDANTTTFDDSNESNFGDEDPESNEQNTNTNTIENNPTTELLNTDEVLAGPILDEVIEDEIVNEEDLEVKIPSRFYFIKNAAHNIQKTFTFNPIKKAEIELKQASEQLLYAQHLAATSEGSEVHEKITEAVEKYEKKLEKISARADKIAEQAPEMKEHFMDRLTDKQIKQQKILNTLENKLPEHAFIKVKEAKEKSFEHLGDVMNRVMDNKEEMTSRIMNVMENQSGSEFRDLKHIEFLKGLEEYIPEEAKEAIMNARYQTMEKFEKHIEELPKEIRAEKFGKYIGFMNGDPARQMKILDEMKANEFIPEDIVNKIDYAKDLAIKKFEYRTEKIKDQDIRKRFLEPFAKGEMDDLKIIKELNENMDPQIRKDIEQHMDNVQQQSIIKFKEKFSDNPDAQATVNRFKLLAKKIQANPNPATFEMVQELEKNLPPEQKEFIRKMEEEAQNAFADKFAKYDDKFINRLATNDPRHLKVLRDMKFDLPPKAMRGIESAIAMQVENIERKMENMSDPEDFFEFRKRIEFDEQAMAEMRRYKPMISEDMERFQFEKIEDRFDKFDSPEEMLMFREKFEHRVNMNDEFKNRISINQPDFFIEIDKRQLQVMERKISEIENPKMIMEYKKRFENAMEAKPELSEKIYDNVPNFMDQIESKQIHFLKERMEADNAEFDVHEIQSKIETMPAFREKFLQDEPSFFDNIQERTGKRKRIMESEQGRDEKVPPQINNISNDQLIKGKIDGSSINSSISSRKAREIAMKSECGQKGLKDNTYYNESTRTWWIDLDIAKEGCNPACVIKADGQTEINWRCTGATGALPQRIINESDQVHPSTGTDNDKFADCPEWINCMPGPDRHGDCKVPTGCEGYTQIAY